MSALPAVTMRRRWIVAALVFAAVTVVMLMPVDAGPITPRWPYFDKLVHCCAWLALAVSAWPAVRTLRASRSTSQRSRLVRAALIVGALAAWGAAVEVLQAFVPPRTPDVWDAVADVAGALVGVAVMAAIEALREGGAGKDEARAQETSR